MGFEPVYFRFTDCAIDEFHGSAPLHLPPTTFSISTLQIAPYVYAPACCDCLNVGDFTQDFEFHCPSISNSGGATGRSPLRRAGTHGFSLPGVVETHRLLGVPDIGLDLIGQRLQGGLFFVDGLDGVCRGSRGTLTPIYAARGNGEGWL
uniref:Uncharacterized protein n=1 Tax=Candidatus Kentrum sp. FW TaxID=2126338 RepID=A0A450TMB7_9GAMM|nr:MAG: hypothetical protein BECKFW1821C_GA0114237_101640 [Candidatus Kentron sp. FW]